MKHTILFALPREPKVMYCFYKYKKRMKVSCFQLSEETKILKSGTFGSLILKSKFFQIVLLI